MSKPHVYNDLLLTPTERERYASQLRELEQEKLPGMQQRLSELGPNDEDASDDILESMAFARGAINILKKVLDEAGSVSPQEAVNAEYVRLGSRVVTKRENEIERTYIIGLTLYDLPKPTEEVSGTTWHAAIASALQGKRVGEKAVVNAPAGKYTLHILSIRQPDSVN